MGTDLENFRAWYVVTLESLYPRRESGIPIFMIALPLLERYLRQRNQIKPQDNLNQACMDDLCSIFSELKSVESGWKFWNVFRNGFLHQATLSLKSKRGQDLPEGWLSHDQPHPVVVDSNGGMCVHPVLFSKRVIKIIEDNFDVFSANGTPLPKVEMYGRIPNTAEEHSFYYGTGVPPSINR